MIGCSHQEIANRVGCSRETLEQRFRPEIEEGQSDGRVQARAKIFQKGVVNGEFACLELYLINQCGCSRKPEVQVTTNVIQNTGSSRSPEQIKRTWSNCRRRSWKNVAVRAQSCFCPSTRMLHLHLDSDAMERLPRGVEDPSSWLRRAMFTTKHP
jgi:hypothetical protein